MEKFEEARCERSVARVDSEANWKNTFCQNESVESNHPLEQRMSSHSSLAGQCAAAITCEALSGCALQLQVSSLLAVADRPDDETPDAHGPTNTAEAVRVNAASSSQVQHDDLQMRGRHT